MTTGIYCRDYDGDGEEYESMDLGSQQPPANDFTEVIQKAHDTVFKYSKDDEKYSDKFFRIEIQGPNLQPLKIVDLPGLSAPPKDGKYTKDETTANRVIETYMRKSNSIIVVVVWAPELIDTSVALQRARLLDPDGERTIGIIASPDEADNEDSLSCVRVIKNQHPAHPLRLGWHVLRNQDFYDSDVRDFDTRDEAETAFFKESPWNFVLETDTGIGHLRTKLRSVMYNHMRRDVPDLVNHIKIKLTERQDQVELCDAQRSTINEMRSFLLQIASGFQRLTRDATSGNYSDHFFGDFGEPTNRLRAELSVLNHAFRDVMKTKGHQYSIELGLDESMEPESEQAYILADTLTETLRRHPYNLKTPPLKPRHEIHSMLETLAVANESKNLPGSGNSDLAIQLFQELSRPWSTIARCHADHVVSHTRQFVGGLLLYLIGGDSASPELNEYVTRRVSDFFEKQSIILEDKINEILEPYVDGYYIPLRASFRSSASRHKARENLQPLPTNQLALPDDNLGTLSHMQDTVSTGGAAEEGTFGAIGILDMAEIYYFSCRRTFVENITNLAIERCLVRKLPEILTPSDIGDLDDKRLEQYAAETETQLAKRKQLNLEISMLQEGLEKCKKWRPLDGLVGRNRNLKNATQASDNTPKSTAGISATAKTADASSKTTCNNGILASTTNDNMSSSGCVNKDSTDPTKPSKAPVNSTLSPKQTLTPSTPKTSPASILSSSKSNKDLFSNSTPAKGTVTPGAPATSTISTPLPSSKSTRSHAFPEPKIDIPVPEYTEPGIPLLCGSTFTGGVFDPSKAPSASSIFAGRSPSPKVSEIETRTASRGGLFS